MTELRILSEEEVTACLDMAEVIDVVRDVYAQKAAGEAVMWPTVFHEFDPGHADMDIKSGFLGASGVFGHKTVSWFEDNPSRGLPDLHGLIVVYDAETGAPLGVLGGSRVTGMRTGASGAVGAEVLGRPDASTLLMVGAGHQALFQIGAALTALPGLARVLVVNPHNPARAAALAATLPERLAAEFGIDAGTVSFEAVDDVAAAVGASDVVVTATMAREPLVRDAWVRPGTHFSCIGADMPGKQEIDPAIIARAIVAVDDRESCAAVGEVEVGLTSGVFTADHVATEIGEVITGRVPGRTRPEDITVFDAAGTALLDLAVARVALDHACERGLGTVVTL